MHRPAIKYYKGARRTILFPAENRGNNDRYLDWSSEEENHHHNECLTSHSCSTVRLQDFFFVVLLLNEGSHVCNGCSLECECAMK